MSACHPFRPVPGQCGPNRRGPLPAPPFDPRDYWATRKCVSRLSASLEAKLDKADVVDPGAEAEAGEAADAKSTYGELNRILGVASDARVLAESKADKLTDRQLAAVNSGIDAGKVAKIAQNESAISEEVSRATTEEARLRALVNAIKTFEVVVADSLPSPSEQYGKKLYLVPSANPETRNVKDEFICVKIEDVWGWEQVGSTAVTIEFDAEPTEGSKNAARSGGIWSWVKSLLPNWLTSDYAEPATVASVANKRDKTDLAVYGFTEWSGVPTGYYIKFDEEFKWAMRSSATDAMVGATVGSETDLRVMFGADDWSGGYPFTATRSRIQTADTLATTNELTAGLAGKLDNNFGMITTSQHPDDALLRLAGGVSSISIMASSAATSDIALSGSDGTIELHVGNTGDGPSITKGGKEVATEEQLSGKRDLTDNTCHKTEFTEWVFSDGVARTLYHNQNPQSNLWYWNNFSQTWDGTDAPPDGSLVAITESESATFLEFNGGLIGLTATRSSVCTDGKKFVTSDVVDGKVSSAVSTNNPAFVSAVRNTPTSEMPEDMPTDWGTYGTVGAALAALAAGLKWIKNILGSVASGYSTFAEWIASKYTKPSGGIPASDLALTVQSSLDAADAAAPQATTYTKTETDAAIRAGSSLGQMTNLGNGRYEYTGALSDASTQTYPREEA